MVVVGNGKDDAKYYYAYALRTGAMHSRVGGEAAHFLGTATSANEIGLLLTTKAANTPTLRALAIIRLSASKELIDRRAD